MPNYSTTTTASSPSYRSSQSSQNIQINTHNSVKITISSPDQSNPNFSKKEEKTSRKKEKKMVYSYTPAYYSSLHDSITSICKTVLPFSFKKRRLPAIAAAEQRLSNLQSDNLKWQQDSFHQILKLMGLCKEGILAETEVAAFRSHLLDTLIASPPDLEHSLILKDKLVFLQELYYAQCITEEEYHSSKRPLLQRLAVQGAVIDTKNIIVGGPKEKKMEEEWSVINLKDDQYILSKESSSSKNKPKQTAIKQIKGAASALGLVSSYKHERLKEEKSVFDHQGNENFKPVDRIKKPARNELGVSQENPFWNSKMPEKESESRSILMSESLPPEVLKVEKQSGGGEKSKRKPFKNLFPKKWLKGDSEDETVPFSLMERSDGEACLGPDGEKLHTDGPSAGLVVDKALGDKVKKELMRIQAEDNSMNKSVQFSDEQIETISTRLPVDKADLKKEFKNHVGEMKTGQNSSDRGKKPETGRWETFDDEDCENYHPNLFASPVIHSVAAKQASFTLVNDVYRKSGTEKMFKNNPFFAY